LLNQLEFSISTNSTIKNFLRYDLLIFSDDVINSKNFNNLSIKIPFFIYKSYSQLHAESNISLNNFQLFEENDKTNQNNIIDKIISFYNQPINYLKETEKRQVIKVQSMKNILYGFKLLFLGIIGLTGYYFAYKKYKLF
jgi:hypothetical protein